MRPSSDCARPPAAGAAAPQSHIYAIRAKRCVRCVCPSKSLFIKKSSVLRNYTVVSTVRARASRPSCRGRRAPHARLSGSSARHTAASGRGGQGGRSRDARRNYEFINWFYNCETGATVLLLYAIYVRPTHVTSPIRHDPECPTVGERYRNNRTHLIASYRARYCCAR